MAQRPLQVLTRRDQLALKAKEKEDAKNGEKGKGRGGGRGRGRGGKGGRGKKAAVEPQGESSMDQENVSSKRAAEATPPPKVSAEQPRDEVDDMQTPVRNLDAALDAEANPGVTASPAIKQPKKRAKNSRATKSTAAKSKAAPRASQKKTEADSEPQAENQDAENQRVEEPKPSKPPSKNLISKARHILQDNSDPAGWHHVTKMLENTKGNERDIDDKSMYWQYSMYWGTRRVGLLQKKAGEKAAHVLSFGGGHCKHIGIPMEACRMYVGSSVAVPHALVGYIAYIYIYTYVFTRGCIPLASFASMYLHGSFWGPNGHAIKRGGTR